MVPILIPVSYTHLDVYKRQAQCLAQRSQLQGQFVEAVRFGDEEGDAEVPQALQLRLGHAAGPDQDQVGLQFQQAFEIDLAVAADGRQVANRRRTRCV